MKTNKTQVTNADPASYIAAIEDEARRRDCAALAALMAKVSNQPARMWGPSIVGFGSRTYALSGGRQGEICAIGFSSRQGDVSIYGVVNENTDAPLLANLGRHKLGKGCLYIRKLSDVDLEVLEELLVNALQEQRL